MAGFDNGLRPWQQTWFPSFQRINQVRTSPEQFHGMNNNYAEQNALFMQAFQTPPHQPSLSGLFNAAPVDYFANSAHFNNIYSQEFPGQPMFYFPQRPHGIPT